MTQPKPFRPDKAAHVQFGDPHTDFILPICLPDPELQVEDALAVLVVTTVEGQRVGGPIGVNAPKHLRGIVEAGLRVKQVGYGGDASPETKGASHTLIASELPHATKLRVK